LRLDREWNELSGILNDAAAVITPLYGRHRVVYDIPPEAPILFVDRDRMVQVISNLLDNACKYGPADIPIRVEASWTEEEMVISVCDGGPGIAPGERENIFQRFYRGERKHGARSIGLGLAICRGIVDAHGGRIWVDAAGGGSAFRFSTPLAAEESDRLAAGASHG
jgi:two-component system sensor histidine kinase KdpD